MYVDTFLKSLLYRDGLKGGPVLLSNSQARPGINFSQPRAHLIVHLSILAERESQSRGGGERSALTFDLSAFHDFGRVAVAVVVNALPSHL